MRIAANLEPVLPRPVGGISRASRERRHASSSVLDLPRAGLRPSRAVATLLGLALPLAACGPDAPTIRSTRETSQGETGPAARVVPSVSAPRPSGPLRVTVLDPPAASNGHWPSWSNGESAMLAWTEPGRDDGHRLVASRLSDEGWGLPVTIASGPDWFVNWADFPQITSAGEDSWLASWLVKSAPGTYDYEIHYAHSGDGGSSWTELGRLHSSDRPAEYGFVSWAPVAIGGYGAVWLDGRHSREVADGAEPEHGGHGHGAGAMSLYGAWIDAAGKVAVETQLDDRVCDCCATSVVALDDGTLVVAYRDRDMDEVRDISILRGHPAKPDSWSQPERLAEDNWLIPGCPVNGPRIARGGDELAVIWFTMKDQLEPCVYVKRSRDGGKSWGEALRIDQGDALGRVDLCYLDDGSAILCWLESVSNLGRWYARVLSPDGTLSEPVELDEVSGERADGFLRLHAGGDSALAAYKSSDAAGLRVLRLSPTGVSAR